MRLPKSSARPDVIVVGTSTGGPDALSALAQSLSVNFPIPILVSQHMPAAFTPFVAESLGRNCLLKVAEAVDGQLIEPGHVWLAPGGCHMTVQRQRGDVVLRVDREIRDNASIDALFRSVAGVYGARALGIILTGMGRDGLAGCNAIRESGGQVWVQDEETSSVWGMPGAVARAGLADRILGLPSMGGALTRISEPVRSPNGRG